MQNIEAQLESTFGKQGGIDDTLKTCTSTVLSQIIEFHEGNRPHTYLTDKLKGKYVHLTPATPVTTGSNVTSAVVDKGEGLPHPTQILFPPEKLDYSWRHQEGGAGFMNCGNTCFLNATLQCLVHTPPLTNYMMSGEHARNCHVVNREKCILCSLELITKKSLTEVADSFSPKWFINNLQYIGRHFRNGRQEDAHEFLRLSLEKMQKCALTGYSHLDKYSKETTVINQIFGGFLRSQVVCLKCKARSNTYDPVLDISLDITNVDNIEQGFKLFVAADKLEMENAYKCNKCKQKVTALKRFSIHKPPNVLTIHLKRFQFAQATFYGCGGKISKPVKYPDRLNIRPYMSHRNGPPKMYKLFATIQHEGYSCNSGHYVANVRCGQTWFHFNDSMRKQASLQRCLNESSAYILFYIKDTGIGQKIMSLPQEMQMPKKQTGVSSWMPSFHKFTGPVKLPMVIKSPGYNGAVRYNAETTVKPILAPLTAKREKISCDLKLQVHSLMTPVKPKPELHQQALATHIKPVSSQHTATYSPKPEPVTTEKPALIPKHDMHTPRLVMKIKDGKSITIETSPDGKRKILSDDEEVPSKRRKKHQKHHSLKPGFVPYETDSMSDSDCGFQDIATKSVSTKHDKLKQNLSIVEKNSIIFDQKLHTTTSVPGNTHLYSTITMKDKLNHANIDLPKDLKIHSPKALLSNPLKRPLGELLSCVTLHETVKQTGLVDWQTRDESILSPSNSSSHSSIHSNNSRSEWSVLPNGLKSCTNRTNVGWTITTSNKHDSDLHTSVSEETVNYSLIESTEIKDVHDTHYCSSRDDVTNDRLCIASPERMQDRSADEYKLYKKLKKHKKHKRHKHGDGDCIFGKLSEKYSGNTHNRDDSGIESSKQSDDYTSYSHSRHDRLFQESSELCDYCKNKSHKKKKHKHKHRKHRKERRHYKEKYAGELEESQNEPDGTVKVKHIDIDESQGNIEIERHLAKQYKHLHSSDSKESHLKRKYENIAEDDGEPKPKKARQQPDSCAELVWAEKSIPEPRPYRSAPATPHQNWDHSVTGGCKRKLASGSSTPLTAVWDGLKTAKVIAKLQQLSRYGYGAPGLDWNGRKCQIDMACETDRVYNKTRTLDDDYDHEYDGGKLKKVKHNHYYERCHQFNGNIFQQDKEQQNKHKTKWSEVKIGSFDMQHNGSNNHIGNPIKSHTVQNFEQVHKRCQTDIGRTGSFLIS